MKKKQFNILLILLTLSCINFLYIVWFFEINRYLPPPFFFDVTDTFNDFYNTLYWSMHDGIYEVWKSVYPPINFIFLRIYQFLFMGDISEMWSPSTIRGSMAGNILPLLLIYAFSLVVAVRISFKHIVDFKTQFILFLLFILSPAFLFAVERGNLIILCIPVLSWYICTKNKIFRPLSLSILINLKPYFVIIYIVLLINRKSHDKNKDLLILTPIFGLIIFLLSGLFLNQPFYLMPLNLLGFAADSAQMSPAEALSFPSSIAAFGYLRGLVTEFKIAPIVGHLVKLILYVYLINMLVLVYNKKINFEELTILAIIFIANFSTSTGGYSLLYYIPVLALSYGKRDWTIFGIIIICIYMGLWDMIPVYNYSGGNSIAYLSGEVVKVSPYMSLGSIIRPIANFSLLVLFIYRLKRYPNEDI